MTVLRETRLLPDASSLLEGFRAGTSDPLDVMRRHLAAIEKLDPVLNAYSAKADDTLALAEAARERWAQGAPMGPLDGLPVIIKDNLVSAGLPASWGNAELAKRIPLQDEAPVASLRQAGAIVLGKGNTPEFAVEGYTGNMTFGVTGNPFDPKRTPGGSSGGVVAAVASGMAVAGLATDGGGSIRRPAGYTGLWGLKPGIGTVRRGGGLPQVLLDFETVGPITRSARDLALFQSVLAPLPAFTERSLKILAVARMTNAPCDPDILVRFAETVERLRSLGHTVTEASLPLDLEPLAEVWSDMAEIGLAHLASKDPAVMGAAAEKYKAMASRGETSTAVDLYEALTRVFALREAVRGLWGYDAVVTPTAAAPPWDATEAYPTTIDGQPAGPRGHAVYTGWVNAAGLPAMAFPVAPEGAMPTGMQLVGDHRSEAMLLAVARALEIRFRN